MNYETDDYEAAAQWCAERGMTGREHHLLPDWISHDCLDQIIVAPEKFQLRVAEYAHDYAMGSRDEL